MKFLYKLEDAITNGSAKFFGLFTKLFLLLTPSKIKIFFNNIKLKIDAKREANKLNATPHVSKLDFIKQKISIIRDKILALNFKQKVVTFKTNSLEKINKIKKTPPKQLGQNFKKGFVDWVNNLRKKLMGVNPQTIIIFITASVTVVIISIKLITLLIHTQKEVKTYKRSIASVDSDKEKEDEEDYKSEKNQSRQKYRKLDKKFYKLTMIKFPVIRKETYDMNYLYFNLNLVTSNRNTIFYLTNHALELQDHFINNIEPIPGNFVMDEEGKRVVKEKIKNEINRFLKEEGFNGSVEDVQVEGFTGY